jgi:hypothetical protein
MRVGLGPPVLYVDVDRRLHDLDGDGYSDVVIGTDLETVEPMKSYRMRVHVFLGGPTPDAISDLEIPIDVNRGGSDFRTIAQIAMVGDLDGNGFRTSRSWIPAPTCTSIEPTPSLVAQPSPLQ